MRDTPDMREMSVNEQRYLAVLAVIRDGDTVTEVAARFGVSRKTLHVWLSRYEAGGLENPGGGWELARDHGRHQLVGIGVIPFPAWP
jgi:transposase